MADEEVKTADEMVSPKALQQAAEADKAAARTFDRLGVWALDFVTTEAPPRRVLLALPGGVSRKGADVLVEPGAAWMPAGKLGVLASPGGKGKTALALHLAGHVAAGARWCGLEVTSPGAVALVVGEEDRDECHRRIKAAWAKLPGDVRQRAAARTLVLPLAGTGDNRLVTENADRTVTKSERADELLAYLKSVAPPEGWALVLVDPFSRFAGMDAEVDNAAATRTMEVLELLTKLPGAPAVLVTHHTRKRGKDDNGADPVELIRGSSAIKDAARWAVMLDADPEDEDGRRRAVLRIVKSNYTSTAYAVELVTQYGIPESGKVRPVRELDAEKTKTKGGGGGKAPKNPGKVAAGAEAHEKRLRPGEV